MGTERRGAQRFEIRQMVRLSRGNEQFIAANTVNISSNGVLCRTDTLLDPGTSLYLMLSPPGGPAEDYVDIDEAMVVRCTPAEQGTGYQCGISFVHIDQNAQEKLDRMLAGLREQ